MKYWFHPAAEEELYEAFDFYESRREGLGRRFARAFQSALDGVLRHPTAWGMFEEPYRLRRLKRFPYGIVYEARGEEVIIVAVMHLHRRPGYWKGRTEELR